MELPGCGNPSTNTNSSRLKEYLDLNFKARQFLYTKITLEILIQLEKKDDYEFKWQLNNIFNCNCKGIGFKHWICFVMFCFEQGRRGETRVFPALRVKEGQFGMDGTNVRRMDSLLQQKWSRRKKIRQSRQSLDVILWCGWSKSFFSDSHLW